MRFEDGTVECIRSAARRDRNVGGSRISRITADGFDAELLDRIEARLNSIDAAAKTVNRRDAIDIDLERTHLESIDARVGATFDSRCQIEKRTHIAAIEWQLT